MRTAAKPFLLAALTSFAAACAPAPNGEANGASPAPETLAYYGTIVQAGTGIEPITILDQEGGDPVRLTGALESELSGLAGGTVHVTGFWTGTYGGSLDVRDYRLLRIDGAEPVVGVLSERAGELWIDGERSVRLPAAPNALRQHIGARVWVVGVADGDALRLQSYGVIAPRTPSP